MPLLPKGEMYLSLTILRIFAIFHRTFTFLLKVTENNIKTLYLVCFFIFQPKITVVHLIKAQILLENFILDIFCYIYLNL